MGDSPERPPAERRHRGGSSWWAGLGQITLPKAGDHPGTRCYVDTLAQVVGTSC